VRPREDRKLANADAGSLNLFDRFSHHRSVVFGRFTAPKGANQFRAREGFCIIAPVVFNQSIHHRRRTKRNSARGGKARHGSVEPLTTSHQPTSFFTSFIIHFSFFFCHFQRREES